LSILTSTTIKPGVQVNKASMKAKEKSMSDWYKTGAEAHDAMDQDEKRRAENANRVFRWFIHKDNVGKDYRLTFLDDLKHPAGYDSPFVFQEHIIWGNKNSKQPMQFTCIKGLPHPDTGEPQSCPLCEMGEAPYLASAYTVVAHDEVVSSKKGGQVYKDEIRLFVCKPSVSKKLRKYASKRKGLRGCLYEVSRETNNSASTGDTFEFDEKRGDKEFAELTENKFAELPQPLNYHELFAPKTAQEIKDILSGKTSYNKDTEEAQTGDTSYDGGPTDDEFVKF
jgi:hypothetical protein